MTKQEQEHDVINVKMKTGEDLVGLREAMDSRSVTIAAPIVLEVYPEHGMTGRSWLMFSDEETVKIPLRDTQYVHQASDTAIGYYRRFMSQIVDATSEDPDDLAQELGVTGYLH